MKLPVLLFALLLSCQGLMAQGPACSHLFAHNEDAQFSRVKIYGDQDEMLRLAALGVPVDHGTHKNGIWFESDYSAEELELIRNAGFKIEVTIPDVQAYYHEEAMKQLENDLGQMDRLGTSGASCRMSDPLDVFPVPSEFNLGTYFNGYFTYAEMEAHLDNMRALYPGLITAKTPLGSMTTHEGRDVWYVRISDNPDVDEDEPSVLYNSITHAREPGGMSVLIYYMYFLLENYSTNNQIKNLVNNTEMYFVPCLNPDGYIYNETTNPSGGGLWRKNRRDNGDGTFGVDLNRNYGFTWGFDNFGSSPFTGSNVYRGPSEASEPETQLIQNFSVAQNFRAVLNYHTFGDLLIYPWGYIDDLYTPDSANFVLVAQKMTLFNSYFYGTPNQTVGYNVNGDADDWQYGEQVAKPKAFSMTPEVGTSFWAPPSNIISYGKENLRMNLLLARLALKAGSLFPISPPLATERNGQFEVEFTRIGLDDGGDYTLRIEPITENIIPGKSQVVSNPELSSRHLVALDYTIHPSTQPGDPVVFKVVVDNDGIYEDETEYTLYYGPATTVFAEQNDVAQNARWQNSGWNFNGNYAANSTARIQLEEAIDLTDAVRANLQFTASWDMEDRFDYAAVYASADGENWEMLCGNHSRPGSDYQIPGAPVYSGRSGQVVENISLDGYTGGKVYLRFETAADDAVEGKGFEIEQLAVQKITADKSRVNTALELGPAVPNPATEAITIALQLPGDAVNAQLELTDALGRVVARQIIEQDATNIHLAVDELEAGIYWYRVVTATVASTAKAVVIE